jgi:hypothetical protein
MRNTRVQWYVEFSYRKQVVDPHFQSYLIQTVHIHSNPASLLPPIVFWYFIYKSDLLILAAYFTLNDGLFNVGSLLQNSLRE